MEDSIMGIIENLSMIEKDLSLPKNIKIKIKDAIGILSNEEKDISLRVDQSLEKLGDICEDPNLGQYMRMQLWSIVSQLESK